MKFINHLEPLMKLAATRHGLETIGRTKTHVIGIGKGADLLQGSDDTAIWRRCPLQFRRRPTFQARALAISTTHSSRSCSSQIWTNHLPSSPLPPTQAPQEPQLLGPANAMIREARKGGRPPPRPMTAPPEVGLLPTLGSGSPECRWEPCIHATVACSRVVGR